MINYEKEYKETLGRARTFIQRWQGIEAIDSELALQELKQIFSEPHESEDERIRNEIISFLKEGKPYHCPNSVRRQEWVTWLENQSVDISLFSSEQRKYMEKYTSLDKVTLIKLLAERDRNVEEITKSIEKQGEQKSEINDNILLRFAFYQYDDDTLYLSSVFVEECNRKHGYGTKILKSAEEVAKTFGVSKIRLKVERNTWMEWWYKKNGYEYLSSEGKYDWLEKRVDQKPVDKVEPKFKVGDTIVEKDLDECGCGTIVNIKDGKYIFDDGCFICIKEQERWQLVNVPKFKVGDWIISSEGTLRHILAVSKTGYETNEGWLTRHDYEKRFHLWTIQDAKIGDVLANKNGAIFINAGNSKGRVTMDCYCYLSVQNEFCIEEHKTGSWFYKDDIHPATKEQCDLLFSKMKEAGYEWDSEKKELKKIEQNPIPKFKVGDTMRTLQEASNGITDGMPIVVSIDNEYYHCNNELIAIKEQDNYEYPPMNKKHNAWSEEDEEKRIDAIKYLEIFDAQGIHGNVALPCINWLKSLKNRVR